MDINIDEIVYRIIELSNVLKFQILKDEHGEYVEYSNIDLDQYSQEVKVKIIKQYLLTKFEGKELIQDINDKILENEMKISDIPREIKQINYQLMLESMKVCYERMTENTEEIKKLEKWILNARNELKEKLLDKQEREMENQQIYTYMHDVFGAQAMELFDNQYEEKSEEEEE